MHFAHACHTTQGTKTCMSNTQQKVKSEEQNVKSEAKQRAMADHA